MQQSTSSGQPPNTAIFSVSRLNGEVRQLLEQGFGQVWLVGEISNFAAPGSGHWYFTLKDSRAQIKAAMFRGNNQRVRMRPQNGMQVMVRAKLTVYEPRGDYQLIVEHMEDAGAGLLQQQYEQLKAELAAQGLFAPEHKRPLPERVQRVGIITSPTGAAIRDVLSVLKRRDPSVEVIIYPSAVQGEKATADLRAMLRLAQERNEVDVLILTRGGGSLEDLWCFNDPELAHLIHASTIPIISAVGHEVDFTIADFVADVRAATPSAAAELVSRDHQHEIIQLQQRRQRAERCMQQLLMSLQRHQQHASQRLQQQHPQRQLQQHEQRLDELNARHNRALLLAVQQATQRQQNIAQRLQQLHPAKELQRQQRNQAELTQRAQTAVQRSLKLANQQLQQQAQALQLISPLQTVARGYALIQTESGDVVRSVNQLAKDEVFSVKVADGDFTAKRLE